MLKLILSVVLMISPCFALFFSNATIHFANGVSNSVISDFNVAPQMGTYDSVLPSGSYTTGQAVSFVFSPDCSVGGVTANVTFNIQVNGTTYPEYFVFSQATNSADIYYHGDRFEVYLSDFLTNDAGRIKNIYLLLKPYIQGADVGATETFIIHHNSTKTKKIDSPGVPYYDIMFNATICNQWDSSLELTELPHFLSKPHDYPLNVLRKGECTSFFSSPRCNGAGLGWGSFISYVQPDTNVTQSIAFQTSFTGWSTWGFLTEDGTKVNITNDYFVNGTANKNPSVIIWFFEPLDITHSN